MDAWSKNFGVWLDRFLLPVDDPGSRLFHMNLLMTFALIGLWLVLSQRTVGWHGIWAFFRGKILRRKYWWNQSTKTDYFFYTFNSILKVFLFVPLLDFGFYFSTATARWLVRQNGGEFGGFDPSPFALAGFTLAAFAWDDLLRFTQHVLMHKIPWLWRFHRLHHSARILTPITLYRAHPVESAIATVRNGLSLGVATGFFLFLFEARFSVFTFLGVNVFGFLFNMLGSNLRHSHIPLSFGPLEYLFISPKQHQVHHSRNPAHFERNYGVSLSLWDALFGSLVRSKDAGEGKLSFGLKKFS